MRGRKADLGTPFRLSQSLPPANPSFFILLFCPRPTQVRTIVRIPAWVGRKRPMPKCVLSTILEVVALLPEHISAPWRSVNVSSFVQVDDQRECANLASLVRNYMVSRLLAQ